MEWISRLTANAKGAQNRQKEDPPPFYACMKYMNWTGEAEGRKPAQPSIP